MTTRDTTVAGTGLLPPEPLSEVRSDLAHQLRATWVVTRRELLRFKQDKARMVPMLRPLLFIPKCAPIGWSAPPVRDRSGLGTGWSRRCSAESAACAGG